MFLARPARVHDRARLLLSLGGISALVCAGLVFVLVAAYVIHKTLDASGFVIFAFFLYVLASYAIPLSGAILVWAIACGEESALVLSSSSVPEAVAEATMGDRWRPWRLWAEVLQPCALLVLLFAMAYATLELILGSSPRPVVSYQIYAVTLVVVLVTFGLFLNAVAQRLRATEAVVARRAQTSDPENRASTYFSWTIKALLFSSVARIVVDAAVAFQSGSAKNAPQRPGEALVASLLFNVPAMCAFVATILALKYRKAAAAVDMPRPLDSMRSP